MIDEINIAGIPVQVVSDKEAENCSYVVCDDPAKWFAAHGTEFIRFSHKKTGRMLDCAEHNGMPV